MDVVSAYSSEKRLVPFPVFPFRMDFEVTGFCNLKCCYCGARPSSSFEPTLDRLLFIFKKTKTETNPFEVLITGGEPFTRKDVVQLLIQAKDIFGRVAVVTNGTLLRKLSRNELVELKRSFGDGSLQVSLDSVDPQINDAIRGGTSDVLCGLDTLEKESIPFTVGIVMTKSSFSNLDQTLRHLFKKYHSLLTVRLLNLYPSVVLGKNYFNLKIDYDDFKRGFNLASSIREETGRRNLELYMSKGNLSLETIFGRNGSNLCSAGLFRAGILADGSVVPCTMLRTEVLGNLYEESWKNIWAKAHVRYRRLQHTASIREQCESANVMELRQRVALGRPSK